MRIWEAPLSTFAKASKGTSAEVVALGLYLLLGTLYRWRMTGAELRRVRKRLKKSQAELAVLLGVRSNTVARWERGERGISEPVARLLKLIAGANKPRRKAT